MIPVTAQNAVEITEAFLGLACTHLDVLLPIYEPCPLNRTRSQQVGNSGPNAMQLAW